LKAFFRSPFAVAVISLAVAAYMALVRSTTRWQVIGEAHAKPVWDNGSGVVWAYWHSRLMVAHAIWPTDVQPVKMLASQSNDGEIISRATERVGRAIIRGSSAKRKQGVVDQKGALAAFKQMIGHARAGGCVGITPDGPRGPRQRAQEGAIRVARSAGVPILPSCASVKGSRYLDTWDRFLLPPLFSRGVIVFGAPIHVPRDADAATLEALRVLLEDTLSDLMHQADSCVGGPCVEPDPVPA
jgi:lysophospholipid acyltransferase (LPLAT)-like uncharacterized protein